MTAPQACDRPPGSTCRMLDEPALAAGPWRDWTTSVETLLDRSHDHRELVTCNSCGQFWLWDWHEETNWTSGDDSSWAIFAAVGSVDEARALARDSAAIASHPRAVYCNRPGDGVETTGRVKGDQS